MEEFVSNCSSSERRNNFHLAANGALETSSQLCTPHSELRKGSLFDMIMFYFMNACLTDFLSHSSCFREIALSEFACASEYNSIISEVTNTINDNSTDTFEETHDTVNRICWYCK